jgi:hypothetical protein
MSRRRKILLAVIISSAIADCCIRGPFFFLPFLVLTIAATLIIVAPLFWLRLHHRISMPIAVAVSILVSYFFCAPPTTGRLFTRQLGVDIANDVSDLRRWNDNWARDPGYYLRFHATEDTVLQIVKNARLSEASSWERPLLPPPRFLLSVPDWWKPNEIENLRMWKGRDARREFWLNLYFDPQSGVVYLEVLTT